MVILFQKRTKVWLYNCNPVCILVFLLCICTGFAYEDAILDEVYTFDNLTGRLMYIDSSLDNSTISVEYSDPSDRYPCLFKHSSGKSMTVTYTEKGMIRAVDMLDENGNVEKSRQVINNYELSPCA